MAIIPNVNRARIMMDLIKDSDVTTLANYAPTEIDYLDGATAIKYADAIMLMHGGVTQDEIDAMGSEEKSVRYINCIRRYHRDALRAANVPSAVAVYRNTQNDAVIAEAITDLGPDE